MITYQVGLDLGQSRDFTSVAIVERVEETGAWDAAAFAYRKTTALRLRYLERMPLGTTYVEVAARVRELVRSGELHGRCELAVDATGVGRAVVDLLRAADLDCQLRAVTVTAGMHETYAKGFYHVPKKKLIVGLQVLLQRGGLQIPAGLAFHGEFLEEISSMRVKAGSGGQEQYGARREGEHDDLVFAVALAYWGARKGGGI